MSEPSSEASGGAASPAGERVEIEMERAPQPAQPSAPQPRPVRPPQRRTAYQSVRRWVVSVLSQRGTAHSIALGVAVGMFVAFLPIVGIQMVVAACAATVVRANRLASIVPVWLTNPLTIPPIYAFTYWIGSLFWGGPAVAEVYAWFIDFENRLVNSSGWDLTAKFSEFLAMGRDILVPLSIGGVLVGGVIGLASYPLTLHSVLRFREARQISRRKRRDRRDRRQQHAAAMAAARGEAPPAHARHGDRRGQAHKPWWRRTA